MCVCVCVLCLIYYILAFWQIAKRSNRFRTNFRVLQLFRHRCRYPVDVAVIRVLFMHIVCSIKSQKQITHHINGQWRCFLCMPCTGILINRFVRVLPVCDVSPLALFFFSIHVFISLSIKWQKTLIMIAASLSHWPWPYEFRLWPAGWDHFRLQQTCKR